MEELNKQNIIGFNMSEFGLGTQAVMISYPCANHWWLDKTSCAFVPSVPAKAFTSGLLEVLLIPVLCWNPLIIPVSENEWSFVSSAPLASSPADLTAKGTLDT